MTVRVKHGRLRLALWLPNLLLGPIAKSAVKHGSEKAVKKGIAVKEVNKSVIKEIVKALRKAKKAHGKLVLVSVKSADGSQVKVIL